MNKTHFKTNLNCSGCISKVQNDLDALLGKDNWKVDTEHSDKILTVFSDISTEKVEEIVKSKGFLIEKI
ncbi:heavy-metal-associated domain-containing protein [Capnocytophaga sp. ARDL2]|uniref:heavy-metal-associated domain-containing protein n=1 Tax=Capnocytophaga sp. ARDL2 TaxID=3238809 RepID=UPI00355765A3